MIHPVPPSNESAGAILLHLIDTEPQIRMRNGFDKESLGSLAESIRRHGQLQPIVVRRNGERYTVIAGHRRVAALPLAGIDWAEAIVTEADDEAAFERQLAENLQREDLTLLDTAEAVRMLHHIHGKPAVVAKIVGKSPAWVSKHLSITAPGFPSLLSSLVEDGHTEDLELILALNQIRKLDTSTRAFVRVLNAVRNGSAGRAEARKVLDQLKAPAFDLDQPAEVQQELDIDDDSDKPGRVEVTFTLSAEQSALFEQIGGVKWLRAQLRAVERA